MCRASCVMSSRGSGRGKSAANLAVDSEAAAWEKKGCHVANKKRKLVQGGSSLVRYVEDEEWVSEGVASQVESDFEEEEEVSLKRKSSRRGSGGLRIEDVGERRGGGGRAIMEDVIDVDGAAASKQGGGTAVAQKIALSAGDVVGPGEDDEALVNRVRQRYTRDGIEAASKLWVHDLLFWNETEGNGIVKLIQEARLYLVAVARGVQPPALRRSIVLPHVTIPQHKIDNESELNAAKERAFKVQIIALRVIHGWVFKSTSRQRGYHAAYKYALNHAATDIAHTIWMGEDWRICVSPMVFHITLDMDMKLPLWFVSADIEDRHENDELVAYQEVSIQRLVGAFTNTVSMANGIDEGRVSHERLKSVADAMRIMLVATMWLMRMSGDDHRAHYDAWVFVQLITKSTLISSMHRSFDARRNIVQAATVITDKLAKPLMTLVAPPLYIPDWASIGVKFSHDATLSSPMEAKKLD
ncbi:hypothetical protein CBR_g30619 [Chara braunii]|uniref:Uncharacterized protein n=1 Tax=Chara braunii TaxID=69332 RepID=A0A388LDG8_CHABU|nr:hypothetical protein CBR_g30619 [Chara braunii]|eukprot:GBG80253.1 hypothetical protein CBR_g30619 [Chara braunii]